MNGFLILRTFGRDGEDCAADDRHSSRDGGEWRVGELKFRITRQRAPSECQEADADEENA